MTQSTFDRASLHPVLEASLSSLDLSLESELARYRRLRPQPKRSQPQLRSERLQPLELFEAGRTPPVVIPPSPATDTPSPVSEPIAAESPASGEASPEVMEVSSIVHQPVPEGQGFATTGHEPPQDYLESSEQLLRSLGLEDPEAKDDNSVKNSLFTPLGIGSILVLLVASALVGSALIDSEGFSYLSLDRLGIGKQNQPTSSNDPTPVVEPIETQPTLNPSPGISTPNLATGEFEALDLQTLPTLPVESPTPAIAPSTSQPQTNATTSPLAPNSVQDLTSALLPPALRPQAVEPVEPSANPAPEAVEPPAPAPAPTNKNMYYVMADYTGGNTFTTALSLVPDAYLVKLPQGVHIQMAAFPQETQAKQFAKELQDKGFTATVYHP